MLTCNASFSRSVRRIVLFGMLISLVAIAIPQASRACTGIVLQRGEHVIFARNFDWPIGKGMIFANQKGVRKTAMTPFANGQTPVEWVSRFGSITINQAGCDLPNFGVNEAGLAVQGFVFARAAYPMKDLRPIIGQTQWKQYLLDNCATVADVLKACRKVRIYSPSSRFGQHYLACDRTGNCVAIDFIEGRMVLHTGKTLPVKAWVNSSTYGECVDYLGEHAGFGGDQPIGRSDSSLDRFVRAADGIAKNEHAVTQAFAILDDVKIDGTTQWQVVYDAEQRKIFYRTRINNRMRQIDLTGVSFTCSRPFLMADLEAIHEGSVNRHLIPYATANHEAFIRSINGVYQFPEDIIQTIARYPETFTCRTASPVE